jgi:small subunit ribosomal protein S14
VAKKSQMIRAAAPAKFSVRKNSRCPLCGRSRAFLRKFNMCRLCFRSLSLKGEIPGVMKASW